MALGRKIEFYATDPTKKNSLESLKRGSGFFMRLIFWICLIGVGLVSLFRPGSMDDVNGQ